MLSEEAKPDLARRFTTHDQIRKEITSCSAMAAMCAEKREVVGLIYWQSCAAYLREMAAKLEDRSCHHA